MFLNDTRWNFFHPSGARSTFFKAFGILLFTGLALLSQACWSGSETKQQANAEPVQNNSGIRDRERNSSVPAYVKEVLSYVKTYHKAPEGYVGGRRFGNYEKRLPLQTKSGEIIRYREWDVKPKVPHKNRGAERLITSSDQRAWYTPDHYESFIEIK